VRGWVVYLPPNEETGHAPQFFAGRTMDGKAFWRYDMHYAEIFQTEEEVVAAALTVDHYCKVIPVERDANGLLRVLR
jgi:hypothetical protein